MTVQELNSIIELMTSRPQPENPPPAEMRARFEKLATFLPTPGDAKTQTVDAGGVPGEWVSAPGVNQDRAVLFLHGGGYVIGSINTHRTLAYNLSKAADARVLLIDYRLAPEHPFPAAVDDAVAAYRWMLDQGLKAGDMAIAGDSAGGGLTMALLLALRDAGVELPACAVPMSPWVDMEGVGESMAANHDIDPMVQKPGLDRMAGMYLNGADARQPLASAIHADLKGLPPLLIQVGTRETLVDDARRLHRKALADGVQSSLEEAGGMIHVWQLFAPMLSEGREAIERAGLFIRTRAGV